MAKTIPETIQFVTSKKKNGEREGKKKRRMGGRERESILPVAGRL